MEDFLGGRGRSKSKGIRWIENLGPFKLMDVGSLRTLGKANVLESSNFRDVKKAPAKGPS